MNWIHDLIFGSSIAHAVFVLSIVISVGILLGKIKFFGISLGITWILFVGIFVGHMELSIDSKILDFIKEFGLILFIYSIGMQVGPSFFSSFKQGGVTLNLLAMTVVLLGTIIAYIIHLISGVSISTMVGILSGAVTNTPGLGAAEQTYKEIAGVSDPNISMGYAIAYPLGVVGIITTILLTKSVFRINLDKETKSIQSFDKSKLTEAHLYSIIVKNSDIYGKYIKDIKKKIDREFVVSRILHSQSGQIEIAQPDSMLNEGDKILIVANMQNIEYVESQIGNRIDMEQNEWLKLDEQLISRRIVISKSEINGKTVGQLKLRSIYGVNITRVNRAGIDLVGNPSLHLQIGDRVTIVGSEKSITNVEKILGNSLKRLREPNLIVIFVGIAMGVLVGSIPFVFPGVPQPVKLGLAGGPLIVSIIISKFGPKYKLITYTTMSANLMLREVGIALFLACVGIGAGANFVKTLLEGGYIWIGYGLIITILPLIIVSIIGRLFFKINYFTLMGLLSGSMTDPPALSFANTSAGNDSPSVSYATVYPLTMFMRVICAQIMILMFV